MKASSLATIALGARAVDCSPPFSAPGSRRTIMRIPIRTPRANVAARRAFTVSLGAAILFVLAPSARGATWYVANNGLDGPGCGARESPCRSISAAIDQSTTVAGDRIIVGPGRYGDLNENGILGEAGEETPAPGCGCVLAVNKGIILMSSHGAAATLIDARRVNSASVTVLLIMQNGEFGRPGKGFTVTNTVDPYAGVAIDSQNVKVRGNQLIRMGTSDPVFHNPAYGILTIDAPQAILIEGNQVIGWGQGIVTFGANKRVRNNAASLNSGPGILTHGDLVGNVAVGNGAGFYVGGTARAIGNAAYGNKLMGFAFLPFPPLTGVVEQNNVAGNGIGPLDPGSLDDLNCGMASYTAGAVATGNYWGSPLGPGPDPADDVCGVRVEVPTVVPFATEPFRVRATIKP